MSLRLRQTTADYLTIAISPALIMTLIGSLVFFLITVFYEGSFQGRLNYIFALFIFAAVLIGRISIEEGTERAALFGIPLAIATFFVINRFAQHPGSWSWAFNLGIIGLVWWCAHKLTWDCTVIDEREDASGEGLLQAAGLAAPALVEPSVSETEAALRSAPATRENPENNVDRQANWWDQYVERRGRAHAPGIWVLYFSLVALPLFGFLQRAIPVGDTASRAFALSLLVVYTASGLGLLLTTSFLGLRRYLRQRRIEMPLPMAGMWISVGTTLIVVVLLFTSLLPRPAAETPFARLPFRITSPDDLRASRYAILKRDGTHDQQQQQPAGPTCDSNGSGAATNESSDEKQAGDGNATGGEEQSQNGSSKESDESKSEKPKSDKPEPEEQDDSAEQDGSAAASEPPSWQPPIELSPGVTWFTALMKILFYVALAMAAVYLLWRYWPRVVAAIRQLLDELRDFWNRLWGRSSDTEAEQTGAKPSGAKSHRPFSDFVDPFMAGTAGQFTPDRLVRYSFEAFEAWAREQGYPREPDLTPREFAARAAPRGTPLATDAHRLAQLYSQVAYAPGSIAAEQTEALRGLWHAMRAESPVTS